MVTAPTDDPDAAAGDPVPLAEAIRVWSQIGWLSFGGPAAQIATMHRMLVEERRWVAEPQFLHALNYCMLLPGPEAQQLVTYLGWLQHGWRGGVLAGGLFVLPGFLSILALSLIYTSAGSAMWLGALFFGLKAGTLAIVVLALRRLAHKALKGRDGWWLATLSFLALFFGDVPFPLVVALAFAWGWYRGRRSEPVAIGMSVPVAGLWGRTLAVVALWLVLWWAPVAVLAIVLGPSHVQTELALFFSKMAVVTFGGAYAVLAYVGQEAVTAHGWLRPGEMLDGLSMAETTPGPLIQVVQFVGYLGAYRNPEPMTSMVAALLAAVVTTWVTFVPSFLWIFAGAPFVERLRQNHRLASGMAAITAAVVGVIANLAVWFFLHVAFQQVEAVHAYGLRFWLPQDWSVDLWAMLVFGVVLWLLQRRRWNVMAALVVAAALGGLRSIFHVP